MDVDLERTHRLTNALLADAADVPRAQPTPGADMPGVGPVITALNACYTSLSERAARQAACAQQHARHTAMAVHNIQAIDGQSAAVLERMLP